MILPIKTLFGRAGLYAGGVPPVIPGVDPVTGLPVGVAERFQAVQDSGPAQYSGGLPVAFGQPTNALLLNTGQVHGASTAYDDTRDRAWEAWRRAGKPVARRKRCGMGDASWDAFVQNAINSGLYTTEQIALLRAGGGAPFGPGAVYGSGAIAGSPGGGVAVTGQASTGLLIGVGVVFGVLVWALARK